MKHFFHNLRDNLEKVIPHLIESQVSFTLGILESEGQGIYIGISAKNWALEPEKSQLRCSILPSTDCVSLGK